MTLLEFLKEEETDLVDRRVYVGVNHYKNDPSVAFRMLKLTKPCKTTGQQVLMISLGVTHECLKANSWSILPSISTIVYCPDINKYQLQLIPRNNKIK